MVAVLKHQQGFLPEEVRRLRLARRAWRDRRRQKNYRRFILARMAKGWLRVGQFRELEWK